MTDRPFDYFYSDPHFGHAKIIEYCSRPFADVAEMDAELERRYCAMVGPNDRVLWLGDASFHGAELAGYMLDRLPGRKVLVRGNHDGTIARCLRLGFEVVTDVLHLRIAGAKVTASHLPPVTEGEPIDPRTFAQHRPARPIAGEFVMHGHTHEKERRVGRRIHVGVDAWDYAPAPWSEIELLIRHAP